MDIAYSVNQVLIRLTAERWFHIVENHDNMAGYYDDVLDTLESPDLVIPGYNSSLIAVKGYGHKRYLAVISRELSQDDGFVISTYFTGKVNRKRVLWKKL